MFKSLSTPSDKVGFPPGAIVHVGDVHQTQTTITLIHWGGIYPHDGGTPYLFQKEKMVIV